ncbi:MAG: response regulator [Pseudodesulfovibrio sp.]|uniref:Response regulator receiver n=1 Tax=Pseudodesulfovibrio aespoeensis (strain ATCC 700646 / DSM 10631 / Aspo-2) TaxID=643562 RepID=E6VUE6_PSEA9|nr:MULTISPECIES: response regulator [Pseudodesulfovibrio]MBU4244109.1 response regulator [Pseudomonadota bacterium]ADU61091.1 response regulator receiver [Pseudodesulfovibrio aespoeensis Aspo-2]MBU4380473.1 response regulator [Pseudomonadota bacterium]MBU4476470.1 response regulator [Pseudomonadota bacterium]MBU4517464.1 response regulator [Pseudomonadota bacterium]
MTEKVLLIDDEVEFLENLSERMRVRGMDVSTAQTTDNAINAVEEAEYDAIVLDLQMPGMNGIEMLKVIKERHPDMQVILLTGQATLEAGIEAMKLGAMDFMEKPADINSLTEKIKKAQAKKMLLVEKKAESRVKDILSGKSW